MLKHKYETRCELNLLPSRTHSRYKYMSYIENTDIHLQIVKLRCRNCNIWVSLFKSVDESDCESRMFTIYSTDGCKAKVFRYLMYSIDSPLLPKSSQLDSFRLEHSALDRKNRKLFVRGTRQKSSLCRHDTYWVYLC